MFIDSGDVEETTWLQVECQLLSIKRRPRPDAPRTPLGDVLRLDGAMMSPVVR